MTEPTPSTPTPPASQSSEAPATPQNPCDSPEVKASTASLSKEEQMAAFEEDLKFNDWGHQPC